MDGQTQKTSTAVDSGTVSISAQSIHRSVVMQCVGGERVRCRRSLVVDSGERGGPRARLARPLHAAERGRAERREGAEDDQLHGE